MQTKALTDKLVKLGYRRTRIRQAMLKAFATTTAPLSAAALQSALTQNGLRPNKTTVYRELDALVRCEMVLAVEFGDGLRRYELDRQPHHHHLICEDCGRVTDITLTQDLHSEQARLTRLHNFSIRRHALEFFGRCSDCA